MGRRVAAESVEGFGRFRVFGVGFVDVGILVYAGEPLVYVRLGLAQVFDVRAEDYVFAASDFYVLPKHDV